MRRLRAALDPLVGDVLRRYRDALAPDLPPRADVTCYLGSRHGP